VIPGAASVRPGPWVVAGSAFAELEARLAALAEAFGLGTEAGALRASYGAVFRRALAFPFGALPTGASRLSEDDTPIQLATAIGAGPPALRFVGDAGPPGAGGEERMRTARAAMTELAAILGIEPELAAVAPLLVELAPEAARALLDDHAGAFWIGAAFAPGATPRMRLYVNGSWGGPEAARGRRTRFAAWFDGAEVWAEAERRMPAALTPLGFALTLAPGRATRGAIYLRAFGLRLADYTRLAEATAGPANAELIAAFGTSLLGPDAAHPTPSAVLSFGFGAGALAAELELCAHCLFRDDAEAETRLLTLVAAQGLDPAPYLTLLRHLSPGARPGPPPRLHSFVGMDANAQSPAYTLYLKPDLAASR
jgi:hypothetical protein